MNAQESREIAQSFKRLEQAYKGLRESKENGCETSVAAHRRDIAWESGRIERIRQGQWQRGY
ncbi:MAG: hypothetical protein PHX68_01360 [Alphaproteobacteria bacterium]|nr:hypothetical protein [Alphaproteobacteria bacterium]